MIIQLWWQDAQLCLIWLIHDTFIRVIYMTHTWHIHTCDLYDSFMTHSYVWFIWLIYDTFIRVIYMTHIWHIHTCDLYDSYMTHSYVWFIWLIHDTFIRVIYMTHIWHIHTWDTHLTRMMRHDMSHASWTCVTWLIHELHICSCKFAMGWLRLVGSLKL